MWAIDYSHPPQRIDGCFPAIVSVRDLASHAQLLWLPVEHETADTTIDALHTLFTEHAAPLVVKFDNGPPFVAQAAGVVAGAARLVYDRCPWQGSYRTSCEKMGWQ